MNRLFLHEESFHQIHPSTYFEREFEEVITFHAPHLYPDYEVIPFKKTVVSPSGNSRPDLIFISKDYRDWYIVEVEMSYHNYASHVEPQLLNLARAKYDDPETVMYICRQCSSLDLEKTRNLIRDEPVKVLLILNEFMDDWANELKNKLGVVTSVFNIFQGRSNQEQTNYPYQVFGISQNYPIYSTFEVAICKGGQSPLPYLRLMDNSYLKFKPGDQIFMEYEGYITSWKVLEGRGNSIWLKINGRDEFLDTKANYRITSLRNNTLLLNKM